MVVSVSNRQRTLSLCITIKGPRNRIYIGKDVIRALGFPAFICIKVNEDMSALAIQPGEEKEYMADADLGEFLEQANSRLSENEPRLAHITANDFNRFCAMGYQACGYDIAEKSPKEQYSRFADGRDDGLSEISPDSPEAFALWYHNSERFGGHPWEVCRGGNSTHIDLYVREDAQGWYLQVAGSAWTKCAEAALFFLALCRAGVPVCIYQAELLKARFLGEEKVGSVPSGVFPAYCHSYFPNEDIIDFTHLPNDKEKLLPYCVWQPLEAVKLKDGENNNA